MSSSLELGASDRLLAASRLPRNPTPSESECRLGAGKPRGCFVGGSWCKTDFGDLIPVDSLNAISAITNQLPATREKRTLTHETSCHTVRDRGKHS
jgi:hypothetical protein